MFPEDRVMVGVIQRKKDLAIAQSAAWYRVPEGRATRGLNAEYIAFFLSRSFGPRNGGIHYYARRSGYELATRAELLPDEAQHPRAQERYHKLQFRPLQARVPPILNPSRRRFSFIYTTWDRFVAAQTLDDLYSHADHLVDRIYYALMDAGFRPQRRWELPGGSSYPAESAQIRVLCEHGELRVSPHGPSDVLINEQNLPATLAAIQAAVKERGGAKMISIPVDF